MKNFGKVVIVGTGNMGSALGSRLLSLGCPVTLVVRSLEHRDHLQTLPELSGAKVEVGSQSVTDAMVVIVSVKPGSLEEVGQELQGKIHPGALVVSVLAGKTVKAVESALGHRAVVRCMPNTAAAYGASVTVWAASGGLSEGDRVTTRRLLACFGVESEVREEKYVDMATALFGSAPAYVLLFLEALVEAGVLIGFPKGKLRELVLGMVKGVVVLCEQNPTVHFAQLRDNISSPAGTTVEGTQVLEHGGFRATVKAAIHAAYAKTKK